MIGTAPSMLAPFQVECAESRSSPTVPEVRMRQAAPPIQDPLVDMGAESHPRCFPQTSIYLWA